MNYQNLKAFALASPNAGEVNQLRGALKALADLTAGQEDIEQCFLLPGNASAATEVKDSLYFSNFDSYDKFRKEVHRLIDVYLQKNDTAPKIFITAYNQAQNKMAQKNIDMLCRAVKEYYKKHNLGTVLTAVLTSRMHKYQYVDLINVPKHLLTFRARIRLLQNKKLRKKVLITTGTINSFSRQNVKTKFKELSQKLKKLKKDADFSDWLQKFEAFVKTPKKVVFCLGGRVDGVEIVFDTNYAKKLFTDAERLVQKGFGVIFVNGPRTPNDVTDYLYEKSLRHQKIIFQNSKKIAVDDEDRQPQRWRIYSGKNEEIFKRLEKIGNIYPAVLGYDNTLVVHTIDGYSCCETAMAAIPTAISSKGLYIDPSLRQDCLNLWQLMCPKYAIDWDDFVTLSCNMKIEPQNLNPQILSNPLRVFAEMTLNILNQMQKKS